MSVCTGFDWMVILGVDGYPGVITIRYTRKCRPLSHSNHCPPSWLWRTAYEAPQIVRAWQWILLWGCFSLFPQTILEGPSGSALRKCLQSYTLLYLSKQVGGIKLILMATKWENFYMTVEAHWIFNCITRCLHICNVCLSIIEKTRSKWHQIPTAVLLFKSLLNVRITRTPKAEASAYDVCVCVYVRIERPYRRHV